MSYAQTPIALLPINPPGHSLQSGEQAGRPEGAEHEAGPVAGRVWRLALSEARAIR